MKLSTCLMLLPVIVACAAAPALGQMNSLAIERSAELQQLYDQRVRIARECHELVDNLYKGGTAGLRHKLEMLTKLHEAEFAAANTYTARLQALEQLVDVTQKNHTAVAADAAQGRASKLEAKDAEYATITAKIRLTEEQRRTISKQNP